MTLNPEKESEEKLMKNHPSIRWAIALVAFCVALIPSAATSQQEKPKDEATSVQRPLAAYRIEINVQEMEAGKAVNSRKYMMVVADNDRGKIRVGNRVPWQSSAGTYQYQDVGMNIDCRPKQLDENLQLYTSVEFSSLAGEPQQAPSFNPVFRMDRTEVESVVTLGKPTLVATMDDVISNRHIEIEATVTKVK
jgi:hypothetical protein